jgi:hypothetical protein
LHAKGATILMVTHSDYDDASFSQERFSWRMALFSEKMNQRTRYFLKFNNHDTYYINHRDSFWISMQLLFQ